MLRSGPDPSAVDPADDWPSILSAMSRGISVWSNFNAVLRSSSLSFAIMSSLSICWVYSIKIAPRLAFSAARTTVSRLA